MAVVTTLLPMVQHDLVVRSYGATKESTNSTGTLQVMLGGVSPKHDARLDRYTGV